MKIVNINYKGIVKKHVSMVHRKAPPYMSVFTSDTGEKLLVFKSGKCRVMGCKKAMHTPTFPIPIEIQSIQSVTASLDMGHEVNLYKLANRLTCKNCMYEPELFPALRLTSAFNPYCVNVFASGKIMILGLKTFDIEPICHDIQRYIYKHLLPIYKQ